MVAPLLDGFGLAGFRGWRLPFFRRSDQAWPQKQQEAGSFLVPGSRQGPQQRHRAADAKANLVVEGKRIQIGVPVPPQDGLQLIGEIRHIGNRLLGSRGQHLPANMRVGSLEEFIVDGLGKGTGGQDEVAGETGVGDDEHVRCLDIGQQPPQLRVRKPVMLLVHVRASVYRNPEAGTGTLVQMPMAGIKDQQGVVGFDFFLQPDQQPEDVGLGRLLIVQLVQTIDAVAGKQDVLDFPGVFDRAGERWPLLVVVDRDDDQVLPADRKRGWSAIGRRDDSAVRFRGCKSSA